jgi:predicted ATP-dependent protease
MKPGQSRKGVGDSEEAAAVDLAVAVAIVSCLKNKPIDADTIIIGEVGLGGEVRAAGQIDIRLNEAAKLGFKTAIIPQGNLSMAKKVKGITIHSAASVEEALKKKLRTKVSITPRAKGGKITIEYYDNDSLSRILDELSIFDTA